MILLRATRIDPVLEDFADLLAQGSGERTAILVDERGGSLGPSRHAKISLTREACERIGLYTPEDFAWRCGDYGFYLAQERFPEESWFWMVDFDVRISGDPAIFFGRCAQHGDVDLLAAHVGPTDAGWWWHATIRARDAAPFRCFFPVVRLTAGAVRRLADKRLAQSRQLLRRMAWPNDEGFVATTAHHAGMVVADLNALGETFYEDETFSYLNVIEGERLDLPSGAPRLYHPVLFGGDYHRKMKRVLADRVVPTPLATRLQRRAVGAINGLMAW